MNIWTLDNPTLDRREAASELRIDESLLEEFNEVFDRAMALAKPVVAYTRVAVEPLSGRSVRAIGYDGAPPQVFESRIVAVNLEGVASIYPYVTTSGRALYDARSREPDPLYAFWMDSVGELLLRPAIEQGRAQIRALYGTGELYAMNPGSLPDFPIKQQRPLFNLLGDVQAAIGVELTETCLMLPVKSVSGFLFESQQHYLNCKFCARGDCPGRREPFDPLMFEEKYGMAAEEYAPKAAR